MGHPVYLQNKHFEVRPNVFVLEVSLTLRIFVDMVSCNKTYDSHLLYYKGRKVLLYSIIRYSKVTLKIYYKYGESNIFCTLSLTVSLDAVLTSSKVLTSSQRLELSWKLISSTNSITRKLGLLFPKNVISYTYTMWIIKSYHTLSYHLT